MSRLQILMHCPSAPCLNLLRALPSVPWWFLLMRAVLQKGGREAGEGKVEEGDRGRGMARSRRQLTKCCLL
jgi:hypothetical protein